MKKIILAIALLLSLGACKTTEIVPQLVPLNVPEELMQRMPQELETIEVPEQ